MKNTIATLATVATLSLGFAGSAFAMENELNMLTGSVYNALRSMDLPTENIGNLTLAQITQIQAFLDQEEGMGRVQQIKKILAEAE